MPDLSEWFYDPEELGAQVEGPVDAQNREQQWMQEVDHIIYDLYGQ